MVYQIEGKSRAVVRVRSGAGDAGLHALEILCMAVLLSATTKFRLVVRSAVVREVEVRTVVCAVGRSPLAAEKQCLPCLLKAA